MKIATGFPNDDRPPARQDVIRCGLAVLILSLALCSVAAAAGEVSAANGLVRPSEISEEAWGEILEHLEVNGVKSYPTTTQETKIFASTPGASASFGWSTAVDGDTLVVGAYGFVSYTGVAFVFERNQGGADTWDEVKKLLASDYSNYSHFGRSVSISGDTLVVGANAAGSGGAAYIFERNNGGADNWGEVALITGSDQGSSASFGFSVDISGDRVIVGASGHNASNGAAYIFERNEGGADVWGQTAKLTAGMPGTVTFGGAVAISGETVVVGAANGDRAFIFERNEGSADGWGQVVEITGSNTADNDDFGGWIDIDHDIVAVGAIWAANGGYARGAVYVFSRNTGGADSWGEVAILGADDAADSHQLGTRVCVDGDVIATGARVSDNPGAVYLFERNEGGADAWGQVDRLAAADGEELEFGVAVSGATVVLGASADSTMAFGAGAAYVFRRSGDTWAQTQKMDADDTAGGDGFAFSLAMDGDVAVVGAWRDDQQKGSVYLFERNQGGADNWGEVAKLTASDGGLYERFGVSVDISDDHLVVGAAAHGAGAYMGGAAYLYRRNLGGADAWGEVTKVMAPDVAVSDQFGWSVSIDRDLVVVGANKGDGAEADTGSAYLFGRNQGGADNWGLITELNASDGEEFDYYGEAVAISDDRVVVGAYGDNSSIGAVYLYQRNYGGADSWGELAKLTASDGVSTDRFGQAVDIHGGTVLVGAQGADKAYVYERNVGGAANWGEQAILTASDGQAFDRFGSAVSLTPSLAAVAAQKGPGVVAEAGAVYLYERNIGGGDNWGELIKLQAADGATDDYFGNAVALSGHLLWCGSPYDDDVPGDSGAAYRFNLQVVVPEADLSVTVDDGSTEVVPGSDTTYVIGVANAGPFDAIGADVADAFPAGLSCTWTCVGTGAATCTAGPVAGDINDLVDLPTGETLTYTALCSIDPGATGSISNTATVTAPVATPDPNAANDTATDVDTLDPQTDFAITVGNGVGTLVAGDPVVTTIVVSNPGPSSVPGATVSDAFPVDLLSLTWTCTGADGGVCNPSGSGDIAESVDLPAGASVTFVVTGTVNPGASAGTMINTATVAVPLSVTELDPADNTAVDSDEIVAPADIIFADGFESGDTIAWE